MNGIHQETPLWKSPSLSKILGAEVLLKMEALQPVGSFKARGMGAACISAFEAGARRIVCSSGGNAGYAVAYAGNRLGLKVTVVVPKSTSSRAKDLIIGEEAEIIIHGDSWDDSHKYAVELSKDGKSSYIHPFDDPVIWRGHSSLVQEIARTISKPGMVVVSVGGGGLLCGLLEGLHDVGWQDVPVLTVETEGADSFISSVEAGKLVTLDAIRSIATTLGARRVTQEALNWTKRHEIVPWRVTDRQAVDACLRFADEQRVLVEPACGASLAAGYGRAAPLLNRGSIVVIVCGGAGVNRGLLEKWDREVI